VGALGGELRCALVWGSQEPIAPQKEIAHYVISGAGATRRRAIAAPAATAKRSFHAWEPSTGLSVRNRLTQYDLQRIENRPLVTDGN